MNFGQALDSLKQGKKVTRIGWSGKEMFIYYVAGTKVKSSNLRGAALDHVGYPDVAEGEDTDVVITINGHIDMKAADGTIVVGWLASQTDMLSEDWEEVA